MGIADRNYSGSTSFGSYHSMTPMVRLLIIANAAIYLLDLLSGQWLGRLGYFSIADTLHGGRLWQLITFQFLHAGLWHVFFNMLSLFYMGPIVERWWGPKRFIAFYLLSGMGGAAFYTALASAGFISPNAYMLGASANIYGVLVAAAVVAPWERIRLMFPPIECTLRQFAIGLIVISVLLTLERSRDSGSEIAHLGGAIAGFLLIRFPVLLGVGLSRPRTKKRRPPAKPKLGPRTTVNLHEVSEVDRILDKVSAQGFHSLTDEERETLHKASQKKP